MRNLLLLPALLAAWVQAKALDLPPPVYDAARDNGDEGSYPVHFHRTFPDDVRAPKVNFLKWSPECDDGLYYFTTPRGWKLMRKPGPMILDSRGELIWAHHYEDVNRFGGEGYNFLVQKYQGKDHLTFWIGEDRVKGHGAGLNYFVNSSYDIVDKFHGGNGMFADLHEFLVTDDNTALMSLYQIVPKDVTRFRSFDPNKPEDQDPNFVWDGIVQEMDLRTHRVKWQWRAAEHVDLDESYKPIVGDGTHTNPWDFFHINSIQKDELGNYLISSRFTQCIRYIDGRTKKTIWRLGGKRNSFLDQSDGNALNFAWQHDARFHSVDTFPNSYTAPPQRPGFTTKLMTFFDNASENQNYTYGLSYSRGLLVELTYPTPGTKTALKGPRKLDKQQQASPDSEQLDLNEAKVKAINGSDPNYTVRVIMSYDNPGGIESSSQGNLQLIPQGPGKDPKILVGYGLNAAWTEFASDGTVLCDVHWAAKTSFETGDMQSYRTYKLPWTGRPKWNPKVILDNDQLYISWLGATDIAEWAIEASTTNTSEGGTWREIQRIRKARFEETFVIPKDIGDAQYVRAVALDKEGARFEHGTSEPMRLEFLATHLPTVNYQPQDSSSRTIIVVSACVTVVALLAYVLHRLYPSWRRRRPFAWRKDVAYQLLDQTELTAADE